MPNLFNYLGYTVFFWASENFEPIHVHVCKGDPTSNATKIWITKSGDCILANNNSRISEHELNKIYKVIRYNFFYILSEWKDFFDIDEVKFYC